MAQELDINKLILPGQPGQPVRQRQVPELQSGRGPEFDFPTFLDPARTPPYTTRSNAGPIVAPVEHKPGFLDSLRRHKRLAATTVAAGTLAVAGYHYGVPLLNKMQSTEQTVAMNCLQIASMAVQDKGLIDPYLNENGIYIPPAKPIDHSKLKSTITESGNVKINLCAQNEAKGMEVSQKGNIVTANLATLALVAQFNAMKLTFDPMQATLTKSSSITQATITEFMNTFTNAGKNSADQKRMLQSAAAQLQLDELEAAEQQNGKPCVAPITNIIIKAVNKQLAIKYPKSTIKIIGEPLPMYITYANDTGMMKLINPSPKNFNIIRSGGAFTCKSAVPS